MRGWFLLLLIPGSALADDAALLRCRDIADASTRLACYDALVPAAKARLGQKQLRQSPEQFGIEGRKSISELDAIESAIPGRFEGWEPRSRIKLANGQIWQIADDSSRYLYLDNPKVTIRRGSLGAFYLEVEGSTWTARVKRVQ